MDEAGTSTTFTEALEQAQRDIKHGWDTARQPYLASYLVAAAACLERLGRGHLPGDGGFGVKWWLPDAGYGVYEDMTDDERAVMEATYTQGALLRAQARGR